jgi:hypothetical protein
VHRPQYRARRHTAASRAGVIESGENGTRVVFDTRRSPAIEVARLRHRIAAQMGFLALDRRNHSQGRVELYQSTQPAVAHSTSARVW